MPGWFNSAHRQRQNGVSVAAVTQPQLWCGEVPARRTYHVWKFALACAKRPVNATVHTRTYNWLDFAVYKWHY